ncbi:MAG TPA: hypothetical protein VIT67_00405, partial [Povalibacter sp.]
ALAPLLILLPACCFAGFIPENQRNVENITINVSPRGDDGGDGSQRRPFRTLKRAQEAVRDANAHANVLIVLVDGIYRLSEPLHFSTGAVGNWYTQARVTGSWDSYNNNVLQDNVLVTDDWPDAAKAVIDNAGIQKQAGVVTYGDAR